MSENKPARQMKLWLLLLTAFLIPVLIMIAVFILKEIYPFGDRCFLRTDLYHQYAMFFSEFQEKLKTGGSLLYSWDIGGGTNFVALYGYYLASPINWLTALVAKDYLIEWISALVILKIGLCSLSFTWYLQDKFGVRSAVMPLFGFAYALSAYMAAYSWNVMWLDCLALAPVIFAGLEALVKKDKGLLYCLSLALCIFTNYYISIMVCLFLVLYFAVELICFVPEQTLPLPAADENGKVKKPSLLPVYAGRIFHFALYSGLAGGLAAVLLLPEIVYLSSTASASSTFPTTLTNYFSVLEMLARHCVGVTCEVGLDHWPNIYCGAAVLFLLPLYYMDRDVAAREKVFKGALLVFLLFSFSYNIPNYIWHGMHYPNSLPCRQSFLYILVLLTMCCETTLHLKKLPGKFIGQSFLIACALLLLWDHLIDVDDFTDVTFFLTLAFTAGAALLAWGYHCRRSLRPLILVLAFVLTSAELTYNTDLTSVSTVSRSAYVKNYDDYETLIAGMNEDNIFYRAEKDSTTRKSKDDGGWLLYPSASVFSSVANSDVTDLYKKLGLEASTNAYSTNGMTPVTASLLGIRYIFSTNGRYNDSIYKLYGNSEDLYAYENPYALSLGYAISADALDILENLSGNPAEYQNELLLAAAGVGGVYTAQEGSASGAEYHVTVSQTGYIYAYITNTSVDNLTAEIDDVTRTYSNVKRGFLIDLGYCVAGTEITLSTKDNYNVTAQVYSLNKENFVQAMENLADEQWEIDTWEDTYVSGTVTSEHGGYLLVTIPYEDGWTVCVDGQEVETKTWQDAFFAVPLTSGTHTVTFTYETEGLKMGILISAGSLLLLIAVTLIRRRKDRKKKLAEAEKEKAPLPEGSLPFREIPEDELDHVPTTDDLV